MRKPAFCIAKTKAQISFTLTAKLITVFTTIHSTMSLLPKSKISSLYPSNSVCVGDVGKPYCWFSHNAAHLGIQWLVFRKCVTEMQGQGHKRIGYLLSLAFGPLK